MASCSMRRRGGMGMNNVKLVRWWLRWTIGNGERFLESDWCMADPELAMLMRRELRKRREKLKEIEQ